MAKYLRSKVDGFVYCYSEVLAQRSDMEEISEAEAEGKKVVRKQKEPTKKVETAAPIKAYTGPAI